ncbi:P-loop containing nucleoside triphosphate hydrolase protein [Suillus paluster]|uniref:P-loop containing nucleoside triphosphate hydrolase protein n=1 Tax=Suillus paluster TaxID=48578 RepID=UPI001B87B835|nr:P-loop containing nucleoside triphosphate hydrolase protein [Suillus paluster]KAG1740783.1 P-loop containing nucleoside triphosphate hydrolase protein [Suillus paluster]
MRSRWNGKDKSHKMKKVDDVLRGFRAKPDDIIIPVMGLTGVGKSTFINTAVGKVVTPVGHGLHSCTAEIQHAFCACPSDPSRRVVLVDTPGFDDTFMDDSVVLSRIAVWLASSYGNDMKLAGVLYIHDISQPRLSGVSHNNLDTFRKLCGEHAEKNVIIATTKWGEVTQEVGERCEQQLKSTTWKKMVENGSQVARFDGSRKSAWDVMMPILANNAAVGALRIQEELVDLGRMIPETDAGRALRVTLKGVAEAHKRAVEELKRNVGDDEQRQRMKDNEKELLELLTEIQELKVPLGTRIKAWFGLG